MAYLILIVSIILTVLGQLLLKKGVVSAGINNLSWSELGGILSKVWHNGFLFLGLFCLGVALLLWLVVVSRMKLSIVYPVASALNFSLVILGAALWFKESILPYQIIGLVLIIAGIFLLSWK